MSKVSKFKPNQPLHILIYTHHMMYTYKCSGYSRVNFWLLNNALHTVKEQKMHSHHEQKSNIKESMKHYMPYAHVLCNKNKN